MQTLEQLEQFAEPGRIAFRDDELAPTAVLVSPGGSAEVSLYGAHVLSYRPVGHSPVLWLASGFKGIKPGAAIRGGVPVCWPWFGPAAGKGAPSHGFVRTRLWELTSAETENDSTSVTLSIASSPETRGIWPHDFRLDLTVKIGQSLELSLATANTGTGTFEIQEALHTYFRIRDISEVLVTGLDGQPYLDRAPGGSDSIQRGAISFSGETDRIYNRHSGMAVITDNALRRRIAVEKSGSAATVVWTPWTDKAARLGDIAGDEWRGFVCVETANAGAAPVGIAPGATHTMSAKITPFLTDAAGKPLAQFK